MAKKSSQRPSCFGHITNSCRQLRLTLKMQPVAYQNVLAKPSHDGQM